MRFLEATQAYKFSTQCTVASFPAEPHAAFISAYHCTNFCEHCARPTEGILMENSHSVFYVDTTNVLSSYFMTVNMHRFPFMRMVYSGNQFFRVGPNISEKFVPGESILGGSKLNVTLPQKTVKQINNECKKILRETR